MKFDDGKDESVRLAAAEALADLGDPALIPAVRRTLGRYRGKKAHPPEVAVTRREVVETATAALAVMGDTDAAARLVDLVIRNNYAKETAINVSEHRPRLPTRTVILTIRNAAEESIRLGHANRRLRRALRQLPPSVWPGLVAKSKTWQGEFATEALLLALAVGEEESLSHEARTALAEIRDRTPMPAVRLLCQTRLRHADPKAKRNPDD